MRQKSGSLAGQLPTLPELKKTGWIALVAFIAAGGVAAVQVFQGTDFGPVINGLLTVAGAALIDFLNTWRKDNTVTALLLACLLLPSAVGCEQSKPHPVGCLCSAARCDCAECQCCAACTGVCR